MNNAGLLVQETHKSKEKKKQEFILLFYRRAGQLDRPGRWAPHAASVLEYEMIVVTTVTTPMFHPTRRGKSRDCSLSPITSADAPLPRT